MPEKWLVIDDSATIQRVIKLAFQDYDVVITEAESCQEAARELSVSIPKLVIADAALAGVQSVQDFSRLAQIAPDSPFVILEGSYDHIDESQFRGAGFRYFLKKPFDAAQLIAITREALGRPIPHRYKEAEVPLDDEPHSFHFGDEMLLGGSTGSRTPPQDIPRPFESRDGFDLGFGRPSSEAQIAKTTFAEDSYVVGDPMSKGTFQDERFETDRDRTDMFQAKPYRPDLADDDADPVGAKRDGFELDTDYLGSGNDSSYLASPLNGMLEPMLKEEMTKLVRQSVEEYCRSHFAELARELILREIDRLTQERSRLLVDK